MIVSAIANSPVTLGNFIRVADQKAPGAHQMKDSTLIHELTHVWQFQTRCIPAGRLDMTDDSGTTVVQEEFCGKLQLVVAAPNYQTERRILNTCETKFVRVNVHPAKPITNPSDECTTAAMRVMQTWISDDAEALRTELVEPGDLPMYLREAGQLDPWRLVYEPQPLQGNECSVRVRLYYDAGCEAAVRVDLLRVADGWRLRGIQYPH